MTDEEYARQLQQEMDRMVAEEQMDKETQEREDARLAWMLQQESESAGSIQRSDDLISFQDEVPRQPVMVDEVDYNNMANQFLGLLLTQATI